MNRPNINDYETKAILDDQELKIKVDLSNFGYLRDLEKYCDELEKREKPMKVHKKKIDRREIKVGSGTFRTIYLFSCPNCGTWISPSHDEKYCSKCGQRLEYEDE